MINKFIGVGRLVRDPELRRTNTGDAVTSFTLALNRNFQSADGQQADYINCVVWNKVAENVEKYCSKGSLVGVEGRLRSRSYDNAQGQKVYVVEVICSSVQFLETKKKENSQQSQVDQDNFYDINSVDLEKNFDNSFNSFDIMEDDIQF
ncbi:single-stranded DNA-binding protein [Candidatus Stoquefichus sp. SB1]|uniref:single-stranded DNA-binding protein n=1 Tax=Candidatus Stoquefichus sp. SB1 TaxID=1658109 RepID=UPI00067EC0ED|nr:single-stranded DNA-binding protein [Candidatus Stoquefichus sp. SB1]